MSHGCNSAVTLSPYRCLVTTLINLTPHPITFTEGPHQGTHEPRGCARVLIPSGTIVGLPDPEAGTAIVVSVIVAEAVLVSGSAREDIFVPGEPVRDTAGRIIGCLRPERVEHASPAARELRRRQEDDRILLKLARIRVYTNAHTAAYLAGRAEGLAFATERAIYAGHGELARVLSDAITDTLAGPPAFPKAEATT